MIVLPGHMSHCPTIDRPSKRKIRSFSWKIEPFLLTKKIYVTIKIEIESPYYLMNTKCARTFLWFSQFRSQFTFQEFSFFSRRDPALFCAWLPLRSWWLALLLEWSDRPNIFQAPMQPRRSRRRRHERRWRRKIERRNRRSGIRSPSKRSSRSRNSLHSTSIHLIEFKNKEIISHFHILVSIFRKPESWSRLMKYFKFVRNYIEASHYID